MIIWWLLLFYISRIWYNKLKSIIFNFTFLLKINKKIKNSFVDRWQIEREKERERRREREHGQGPDLRGRPLYPVWVPTRCPWEIRMPETPSSFHLHNSDDRLKLLWKFRNAPPLPKKSPAWFPRKLPSITINSRWISLKRIWRERSGTDWK